jgi:hypothetical protein
MMRLSIFWTCPFSEVLLDVYRVYQLKSNSKTVTYRGTQMKSEADSPPCNRLSQPLPWYESRSLLLLSRCSGQLRNSFAGANMMYSQEECTFILEHYFTSELFAFFREAISNALPDKKIPNKSTVHRLVTMCLWMLVCGRRSVSVKLFRYFFVTRKNKNNSLFLLYWCYQSLQILL